MFSGFFYPSSTKIHIKTHFTGAQFGVLFYNVDKVRDSSLNNIDHKFITDFELYLKSVRNCAHNTTIKYVTNFKKIVRQILANEWIKKNTFLNDKARPKEVVLEFLTEEEIQTMTEKELYTEGLDQVRDIFIFCYFTDLACIDIKKY